ncbi:MAG: hypothetical protein ABL870_12410 [Sediminibacterium sp.]
MSNQNNTNQNPSDKPIQREELPKDEVSYLYGFKMIVTHDKVGKALVMSFPNRKSSVESKTKKDE